MADPPPPPAIIARRRREKEEGCAPFFFFLRLLPGGSLHGWVGGPEASDGFEVVPQSGRGPVHLAGRFPPAQILTGQPLLVREGRS